MTSNQELVFDNEYIVLKDDPNRFVMMSWENDLMKHHAKLVTQNGGDILEIGFGMGISAQFIQDFGCASHTIVESHPEILKNLYGWAQDKPNVKVVEGDWFALRDTLYQFQYDGIFYDADCINMNQFRKIIVDRVLKPKGVFTYFEPKNFDRYGYGDELKQDYIEIKVDIPKNAYHMDSTCACPYIVNTSAND